MIQRAGIEEIYDPAIELEAENRSGSGSAGNTVDPEPNHCKGVAMDSLTYPHSLVEAFERNQLALSILSHRRDPESVDQAIAALKGASITDLMGPPVEAA